METVVYLLNFSPIGNTNFTNKRFSGSSSVVYTVFDRAEI